MCLGLQIFAQGLVLPFPEAPQALGTPCLPSCFSCWDASLRPSDLRAAKGSYFFYYLFIYSAASVLHCIMRALSLWHLGLVALRHP